jgi:hypothetical protein
MGRSRSTIGTKNNAYRILVRKQEWKRSIGRQRRRWRTILGWRMSFAGMLRRVAHVRTDVSQKRRASIIRVTRIGELGTLVVTSLVHLFLSPWWWRYVPPKSRFVQEPHGVTSQKTAFFMVTAVKTSNLSCSFPLYEACFGSLQRHTLVD